MGNVRVAASLIVLGLLLVLISFVLPYLAPSAIEGNWTPEQAQEHAKWSAESHRLAHEREHGSDAAKRAFAEADAKYKEGDAQLVRAQTLPDRITFWIGCAGGAVLLLGLGSYYNYQRKQD
jgi:hypothetical protein